MAQSESGIDLPDWLSPVLIREFRQKAREDHFTGLFLLVHGICLVTVCIELALGHLLSSKGFLLPGNGSLLSLPLFLVFALILPRSQLSALQPEVGQDRNIELLAISRLSRWQLVRDKFGYAVIFSLLLLTSLLPYLLVQPLAGISDLSSSLNLLFVLGTTNALMTAFFLGASGFRSYLTRLFVLVFFVITFLVSAAFLGIGPGTAGSPSLLREGGWILGGLLYVLLSLQLGRSRIAICSNPLEPPSSAVVLLLAFCCPVVLGVGSQFLAGWGSWVVCILTISGLFAFDRDRG